MKVPPGTQSGTVFRLRGKVSSHRVASAAICVMRVLVRTPRRSTSARLALLELAEPAVASQPPQKQRFAAAMAQRKG